MRPNGFVTRQKILAVSLAACFLAAWTLAVLWLRERASNGQLRALNALNEIAKPPRDQAGQTQPKTFSLEEASVPARTVIVVFAMEDIEKYAKAMIDHYQDLITLSRSMRGGDVETTLNYETTQDLMNVASLYEIEMGHLQYLLLIDSLVAHEADRQRIKPEIRRDVREVAGRIDLSIKQVNLDLANLKSQAVIATAVRLRDDLRDLKALLLTGN